MLLIEEQHDACRLHIKGRGHGGEKSIYGLNNMVIVDHSAVLKVVVATAVCRSINKITTHKSNVYEP